MVHFHNRIAHSVKEIAVVCDHEQGAARAAQIVLEVFDCVDVQVVGGLVHDEEVCLACKHLRKGDSLDLTSGKFLHLLRTVREIEVGQELDDTPLVLPKVLLVEVCDIVLAGCHNLVEYAFLGVEFIILFQKGYAYVLEKHNLAT